MSYKIILTEALGEVGLLVHKDLGGDDGAEGEEGLQQVGIGELWRQVVDEQVGSVRPFVRLQRRGGGGGGGGKGGGGGGGREEVGGRVQLLRQAGR